MERLTARTHDGHAYLANVKDDEQEVECRSRNTAQCIMDSWDRLAAYEDTGMEPEEIKELSELKTSLTEAEQKMLNDYLSLGSLARLRELAEADRDGRLVVLPCPFYSEVYALAQVGNEIIHGELRSTNKDYCLIVNLEGNLTSKGKTWHGVQVRMQDVFPTRPEAEAAMKGEQEAHDEQA